MNTWLHHDGYTYCENVKTWSEAGEENGFYCHEKPDLALIPLVDGGLISRKQLYESIALAIDLDLTEDARRMYDSYHAP